MYLSWNWQVAQRPQIFHLFPWQLHWIRLWPICLLLRLFFSCSFSWPASLVVNTFLLLSIYAFDWIIVSLNPPSLGLQRICHFRVTVTYMLVLIYADFSKIIFQILLVLHRVSSFIFILFCLHFPLIELGSSLNALCTLGTKVLFYFAQFYCNSLHCIDMLEESECGQLCSSWL